MRAFFSGRESAREGERGRVVAFEEIVSNAGGRTAAITAVLLGAALVEEREDQVKLYVSKREGAPERPV